MGFEFGRLKFSLMFLFFLVHQAIAGVLTQSINLDLTTQNVPASFSASNPFSKVLTNLQGYTNLKVLNTSSCGFFVNVAYGSVAPPDDSPQNMKIFEAAKSPGLIMGDLQIANSVFVRSNCSPSGPATTGTLSIEVW